MHMRRAFYIGRFQPFHLGHYSTICTIAKEVDELVIGIGSARRVMTLRTRLLQVKGLLMIRHALEDADVKHYAIPLKISSATLSGYLTSFPCPLPLM
jgi:nicotinamide-nucleotide adenylyltransferase